MACKIFPSNASLFFFPHLPFFCPQVASKGIFKKVISESYYSVLIDTLQKQKLSSKTGVSFLSLSYTHLSRDFYDLSLYLQFHNIDVFE